MQLPRLIFRARCGKGHGAQQVFTREMLAEALAAGVVSFYCGKCGEHWAPTVEERVRLRGLVKRSIQPVEQGP